MERLKKFVAEFKKEKERYILATISYTLLFALLILIGIALMVKATAKEPEIDYRTYADSLDLIEIIDCENLTLEMLENRNGKLIIERVIGVVENAETGDGRILYGDPDYYYISYNSVPGVENGNVICTYFIYNPDNNYYDDTVARFDYVIDK